MPRSSTCRWKRPSSTSTRRTRSPRIEVFIDDPDSVDRLRPLIETAAARPLFLIDWRQRNRTFFSALVVERNVMFIILTLIILVATLNVISGMTCW